MKTRTILTMLIILSSFIGTIGAQTSSKDPVYLEVISNTTKTINYTVGVYPLTCKNNDSGDRTYLTMYILNNGSEPLNWTKANHILIVLKNNTMTSNYNTVAETGNYACNYTVDATKGFHEQTLCYDGNFSVNDIANIYLLENGEIYQLRYNKADE